MSSLQEIWSFDVKLLVVEKRESITDSKNSELVIEELVLLPVETHVEPKPLGRFQGGESCSGGHVVGQDQVISIDAKVKCILKYPMPTMKKELMR